MKVIYVFVILAGILSFGVYINYVYYTNLTDQHHHEIDDTISQQYLNDNLTWDELIRDCGAHVMIENSARANEIFNRKYYKQVIEWKGYFLNAFVQQLGPGVNLDHLYNINVRMIPSESLRDADLFLSLNTNKYHEYESLIRSLSTGDAIKFRASFESIGNEWKTHHLHLIHIEMTEDFIEEDKKIVLFQGIGFNITGHLKNEEEMKEISNPQ